MRTASRSASQYERTAMSSVIVYPSGGTVAVQFDHKSHGGHREEHGSGGVKPAGPRATRGAEGSSTPFQRIAHAGRDLVDRHPGIAVSIERSAGLELHQIEVDPYADYKLIDRHSTGAIAV